MTAVEPVRFVLRRFHRGLPDVIVRQGASFVTHRYSVELIFSGDGMFREDVMTRTPYPTLGGSRHQPPPGLPWGSPHPRPPGPGASDANGGGAARRSSPKLREHRWLRGGGSGGAMIRWKRLAAEISSEIGAELQLG